MQDDSVLGHVTGNAEREFARIIITVEMTHGGESLLQKI